MQFWASFGRGAIVESVDGENIKKEKITTDSLQFNGVPERAIIETAYLVAKIQASELHPDERISNLVQI